MVFASPSAARADGPLPDFALRGVAFHPGDLEYSPNDDLVHPTIIKTEGRVKNPLGKYYLYYAPHEHVAISMAYSDSMDGPWKEHKQNPVIEGPSAPDIRWIEEHGRFFMWGHRKNSQTELWTSQDGLNFEYHSVSIRASNIGTRNATYSRVYEYPLERFDSKYIMLYSSASKNPRLIVYATARKFEGQTNRSSAVPAEFQQIRSGRPSYDTSESWLGDERTGPLPSQPRRNSNDTLD